MIHAEICEIYRWNHVPQAFPSSHGAVYNRSSSPRIVLRLGWLAQARCLSGRDMKAHKRYHQTLPIHQDLLLPENRKTVVQMDVLDRPARAMQSLPFAQIFSANGRT